MKNRWFYLKKWDLDIFQSYIQPMKTSTKSDLIYGNLVTNQNLWFSHLKVGLDLYSILYLTNEEWNWVVSSWDYQSNVERFGERIFKHTPF